MLNSFLSVVGVINPALVEELKNNILEHVKALSTQQGTTERVSPLLLYFDSRGGDVDGVKELADMIGNLSCPTIALIGSYCTSAAYWLASQCDEIWALSSTARVGGAGAMVSFVRFDESHKGLFGETVDVYAPQSTRKNEEVRLLLEGNPAPYQNEILAPLVEVLLEDIVRGRGERLTEPNDEALRSGVTLYASAALGRGWIDKILATRMELPGALRSYLDTVESSSLPLESPTPVAPKENTVNSALEVVGGVEGPSMATETAQTEEKTPLLTTEEEQPLQTQLAPVSGVGMVQDGSTQLVAYCATNADNPLAVIDAIRKERAGI